MDKTAEQSVLSTTCPLFSGSTIMTFDLVCDITVRTQPPSPPPPPPLPPHLHATT